MGGYNLGGVRLAPHRFVDPPPDSALRVVVAGASTVQGYPHPARLSAPSFLETLLADALDRPVQVINLGITSLASFAVARVVDTAVATLKPDLVVVYTGHNEFYGVYGAAALRQGGPYPWTRHLHYRLMQLRLAGLARWIGGHFRRPAAADQNLLAAMGSVGLVPPGDPVRARAARQLQASLDDMVDACQRSGSQLVLCTPVGNDAGFTPDTSSTAGEAAAAHFGRARRLAAAGRVGEARQAYVAARDADPAPWRAPSDLVGIVRAVAARQPAALADAEWRLAAAGPDSLVGWDLIVDHVHPSARGHALLARSVVDALVGAPAPFTVAPDWERAALTDVELLAAHGDLPVEAYALALAMAELLSRPPMPRPDRAAWLRHHADELWGRLEEAEREGFHAWERLRRRPPLVLPVADKLFGVRRFGSAAKHYRATRLEAPFTAWGDLWPALREGRSLLYLQEGRLTPAQRLELEKTRIRADLLGHARDTDAGFMRTFSDYTRRLLAAPIQVIP
jgi:lysophospholipase L1-like esterase